MKRASVLALLLAIVPLTWAEEAKPEPDVTDSAETAPVSEEAATSIPASPAETPTASADSSIPPVASAPSPESTVTPVSSETAPVPAEPAGMSAASHKVVHGDTLWDLAGSYLKDPFLWQKIYDANRDKIENPSLIFPDQEFVIPTVEAAATLAAPPETSAAEPSVEEPAAVPLTTVAKPEAEPMPEAMPEQETVAEAPAQAEDMDAEAAPRKKMIEPSEDVVVEAPVETDDKTQDEREAKKKRTMAVPGAGFMGGMADSFLADENWEYDGYILRDRDQRMMISQGDVVFLNIGAASGVKPKMVANIYRVGKKVKDPYLKKKAGRMVKRVGSAMVTGQVTDEGCTAVVTNSLEPIRIGDIVKFIAR